MIFVDVYIEHNTLSLNQTFTYRCEQKVYIGSRVKVPFGYQVLIGFVKSIKETCSLENIKDVIEVIDQESLLNDEMLQLAEYMSHAYMASLISCYKMMLPPALRPESNHQKIIYEEYIQVKNTLIPMTSKQQEFLNSFTYPVKASLFRKKSNSMARTLIEKGIVEIFQQEKQFQLVQTGKDKIVTLKEEQKSAIQEILEGHDLIYLLHGVTGSGKTEVFLRLASEVLNKGKQVLFLVPEIGLTPMMIERVSARFGQDIAIFHSRLSSQEKYDQYQLVKKKKVNIVVGTRSAIFMPFTDLGLILMDEEHDMSYKQDQMPKYHTRDIAIYRAKYHKCKLVLASATPSLESYARAYKKVYHLITLKKRINESMPQIHIVDMSKEKIRAGLSESLENAMRDRFSKKEQVLLLLNRRGYLPYVRCSSCQTVLTCPDCGIALSYHKKENSCICHICGKSIPFTGICQECGSRSFYQTGMGTEKLEEQLQTLFPEQKIIRMDQDSTRKKNAHQKLLKEFEETGDILLGTQMITKGLDFERVTCVGILNADASLIRQDYRSSETAYEILEQASGRSGRGQRQGEVFIQTFQPDHYVMEAVQNHDYISFFHQEMRYRHLGWYPPYSFLCTFVFSSNDYEKTLQAAQECKSYFSEYKALGPIEITMRNKQRRVRVLLKHNRLEEMENLVNGYLKMKKNSVKCEINMHPMLVEE